METYKILIIIACAIIIFSTIYIYLGKVIKKGISKPKVKEEGESKKGNNNTIQFHLKPKQETKIINDSIKLMDSFNHLEKGIKRTLFFINIIIWLWSKKNEIKKIINIIIFTIPIVCLFLHIKSLPDGYLNLFYMYSLFLLYLFIIGGITSSSKPKTTSKPDIQSVEERNNLIKFYSANAPSRIPKEWKPNMLSLPPKPAPVKYFDDVFGSNSNHKHKDFILKHAYFGGVNKFFYDEAPYNKEVPVEYIPIGLLNEIDLFEKQQVKQQELIVSWERKYSIEKIIQWRFYYAEKMVDNYLKYHKK